MPLLRQDYPTRVRLNRLRSRVAGHGKNFGFSTTQANGFVQVQAHNFPEILERRARDSVYTLENHLSTIRAPSCTK